MGRERFYFSEGPGDFPLMDGWSAKGVSCSHNVLFFKKIRKNIEENMEEEVNDGIRLLSGQTGRLPDKQDHTQTYGF